MQSKFGFLGNCRSVAVSELHSVSHLIHLFNSHPWSTQFKGADQSAPYSPRRGWQYYTAQHGQEGSATLLLPVPVLTEYTLLPPDWRILYCSDLQLYQISLQTKESRRTDVPVEMVSYGAKLGLSHDNIYMDPNLTSVVGYVLSKVSFFDIFVFILHRWKRVVQIDRLFKETAQLAPCFQPPDETVGFYFNSKTGVLLDLGRGRSRLT